MDQEQPSHNEEPLSQLSKKELVKIILTQQKIITELQAKIEKLILSRDLDSKNSSKPPSSDLLKKPEKKQEGKEKEKQSQKKKPGGQLGHPGKTRMIWTSRPLRTLESTKM
ncbi:hypothetical protein Xen7305DRAFT_00021580 [Xenococcus sp. PCC 7305]|nr:hypothetical protein Xen7305DRAFT_00021580 [Xenococcus sp. PCC 7305]